MAVKTLSMIAYEFRASKERANRIPIRIKRKILRINVKFMEIKDLGNK